MKTVKFKIIKSVPINHMFTKILLCLFAGLFIQTVSAQTQPPQENFALKQSTPTSPEAAMLGRFGDIPIGYYTGTANVSVPIYTIKEGGVEIPITLSYHNSGIRVEDEASNVGLGWLMEPGGAIIQVVNGIEDAGDFFAYSGTSTLPADYAFLKSHVSVQGVQGARNQIGTNSFLCVGSTTNGDSYFSMQSLVLGYGQPDIYQYYFPGGYSGKFYINPETRLPVLIDKKSEINFQKTTAGWSATTLDGNVFYFESQETVQLNLNKNAGYTWKLSRVVLHNGKVITFSYTPGHYVWQTSSESYHTPFPLPANINHIDPLLPGYADNTVKPAGSETDHNVLTITQITTGDEIITFNLEGRADIPISRIKSVDIRSAVTNRLLKTFNFAYDYFANSVVGGTYSNPQYNPAFSPPVADIYSKRLKLVSVQETGYDALGNAANNPPYQFTYDETNPLPLKTSYARDYWGYYNGAPNTQLTPDLTYFYYAGALQGQFPYYILSAVNGANRIPDKTKITSGMLTQIKYPTGGYTQFGYESNTFSNGNIPDADKLAAYRSGFNLQDQNSPGDPTSGTFTLPRSMALSFTNTFGIGNPSNTTVTFDDIENATITLSKVSGGTTTQLRQWIVPPSARAGFSAYTITDSYYFEYDPAAQYTMVVSLPDNVGNQNSAGTGATVSSICTFYNIPNATPPANSGGGVRVASIRNYDNTAALISNKSIKYINTDGSTSGLLMSPLQFAYDRYMAFEYLYYVPCLRGEPAPNWLDESVCPMKNTGQGDVWWLSSESQVPLSDAAGGNIVGYSRVEETELANNVSTNGKRVYYYNNQVSQTGFSVPDNPNLLNGFLSKEEVYDNALNKLAETNYNYGNYFDFTTTAYKSIYNLVTNYECDPFAPLHLPSYPPDTYLILEYPINSKWYMLNNKVTTQYYGGNSIASTTNYSYNRIGQLNQQTTVNSKNQTLTSNYVYPIDVATPPQSVQNLINAGFYNNILEKHELNNGVETSQVKVQYNTINNQLVESEIDKSYNSGTPYTEATFDQYGPNMARTQVSEKGVLPSSFIYDNTNTDIIANVKGAGIADIAYTSFEPNQTGNWAIGNGSYTPVLAGITGRYAYNFSAGALSKSGLNANTTYAISYWTTNSAGESVSNPVAGSVVQLGVINGWYHYLCYVRGQTTVTITGSNYIDEVRLYPVNAQMTTYTYEPLVGISSTSDAKGQTTYYEYDAFARLRAIRDKDNNIVKSFCYNYAGQSTNCFVPSLNGGSTMVYARLEYGSSNFSSAPNFQGAYDYTDTEDLYIRFYSDAACTAPLTLTSSLTVSLGDNGTFWDNMSNSYSYSTGGNSYTVPSGVSSYYLGAQTISYEHTFYDFFGDSINGSLGNFWDNYDSWTYYLVAGSGYTIEF